MREIAHVWIVISMLSMGTFFLHWHQRKEIEILKEAVAVLLQKEITRKEEKADKGSNNLEIELAVTIIEHGWSECLNGTCTDDGETTYKEFE